MYRPGFGDCFLLTFPDERGEAVHCLIDCGVHTRWKPNGTDRKTGSARIKEIVEDIRDATGGHLHVLIVTHEHADHVSGFHTAGKTFADMTVEQVWMGWTEDPESSKARSLDKTRSMMLNKLRALGPSLAESGNPFAYDNVGQVVGFFDIPGSDDAPFGVSTRAARDQALELSSVRRFLKPHEEPLALPGLDKERVRVFVLGPPEDEKMLKAARPTGEEGEVYEGKDAHEADHEPAPDQRVEFEAFDHVYQPFAGNHRIPLDWVKANPEKYAFQHLHYGFEEDSENAWRRIGADLTGAAEDLALRLDGATNNTSLVLAFELRETGRVLLFPGDAQVGNWKSWHLRRWTEENGADPDEVITAKDLLARTVLYKVAHHGSHNATLKKLGLEMMSSPELTAMIPVDQEWAAARRPYPWLMPFAPMYDDLVRRTNGRILRTDIGLGEGPEERWHPFAEPRLTPLYIDLHIPDGRSPSSEEEAGGRKKRETGRE